MSETPQEPDAQHLGAMEISSVGNTVQRAAGTQSPPNFSVIAVPSCAAMLGTVFPSGTPSPDEAENPNYTTAPFSGPSYDVVFTPNGASNVGNLNSLERLTKDKVYTLEEVTAALKLETATGITAEDHHSSGVETSKATADEKLEIMSLSHINLQFSGNSSAGAKKIKGPCLSSTHVDFGQSPQNAYSPTDDQVLGNNSLPPTREDVQAFIKFLTDLMPTVKYPALNMQTSEPWKLSNVAIRYCAGTSETRHIVDLAVEAFPLWDDNTRNKQMGWLAEQRINFHTRIEDWNNSSHHDCPTPLPTGPEIALFNDPDMFRVRARQYISSPSNGFRNEVALLLRGKLVWDTDFHTRAIIKSLERRRMLWVLLATRNQNHGLPPPSGECPSCSLHAHSWKPPKLDADPVSPIQEPYRCVTCANLYPCCFVCNIEHSDDGLIPPWEVPEWSELAIGHRDVLVFEYHAAMDRIEGRAGIRYNRSGASPDHWHPAEGEAQPLYNRRFHDTGPDLTESLISHNSDGDDEFNALEEFLDYTAVYGIGVLDPESLPRSSMPNIV